MSITDHHGNPTGSRQWDANATAADLFNFAAKFPPDEPVTAVLVLSQGWARLRTRDGRSIYIDAVIEP